MSSQMVSDESFESEEAKTDSASVTWRANHPDHAPPIYIEDDGGVDIPPFYDSLVRPRLTTFWGYDGSW
jgi:hypothetical protein